MYSQGVIYGLGLVERGSLETHISFLESSHIRKRVDHVVNRVSLCLFVHFRLSSVSPMILSNSK